MKYLSPIREVDDLSLVLYDACWVDSLRSKWRLHPHAAREVTSPKFRIARNRFRGRMLKSRIPFTLLAGFLFFTMYGGVPVAHVQAQNPYPKTVLCRVMESFEDAHLGVTAIIFHQRDKTDGPRLGEILQNHSGETMVIVLSDGHSRRATVFRMKSCFGRGLLLLPATVKLVAGAEFTLGFSETR